MTRTRQISAVDATMRNRVLNQTHSPNAQGKQRGYPCNCSHASRGNTGGLLQKLRSGNTQSLLSGGCSSMREFCDSVQSVTTDLSGLLASIENILPLISTCLSMVQAKDTIPVIASMANAPATLPLTTPNTQLSHQSPKPPATRPESGKQPRPEDIQQLLENPMVKNILASFMQNMANK